jgi:hypothetical protein
VVESPCPLLANREPVRAPLPWTRRSRLCLTFDELNQYTNRQINNVRQNKRDIKVEPKGSRLLHATRL